MASQSADNAAPVEGPIVPRWYFAPVALAMILGGMLGGAASVPGPLWFRAACGAACWLIGVAVLMPARWRVRRLDEFQTQIFWQGVAWAGIATVLYVVFMSFYFAIVPGAASALGATGMAPGLCALMAALMIGSLERRARRATQAFRE